MEQEHEYRGIKQTLCWDCANACGRCNWSQRFEPVDGWAAAYNEKYDSYCVTDCPEFERDALNGGLRRLPEKKRA